MHVIETQNGKNLRGEKISNFYLSNTKNPSEGKPTRLGADKRDKIKKALQSEMVDKVYRRGNKLFKFMLNGTEKQL